MQVVRIFTPSPGVAQFERMRATDSSVRRRTFKMKRLWIYAVLFPPVVWLFLCAANRVNPLAGTMFSIASTITFAYAVGIIPALLTGLAHHLLKAKGYRSILSVFVGAAAVPLVFAMFFRMDARLLFASSVGGIVAAMCCWAASRIKRTR